MRLVAARLPADMCEDALIAEGTAAKAEAFADLLAAPCGFLGFGAWAGHDVWFVTKGLAFFGYVPDLFDGAPTEKGPVLPAACLLHWEVT